MLSRKSLYAFTLTYSDLVDLLLQLSHWFVVVQSVCFFTQLRLTLTFSAYLDSFCFSSEDIKLVDLLLHLVSQHSELVHQCSLLIYHLAQRRDQMT